MRWSVLLTTFLAAVVSAAPAVDTPKKSCPPKTTTPVRDDIEVVADGGSRSVVYVQTFKQPNGQALSILPLLNQNTRVTHVILAALHINSEPTDIHLNDDDLNDPKWDTLWKEVKTLQNAGIKVMVMMGGAAPGTYSSSRLGGTDEVFQKYYKPLVSELKRLGLNGIDIDVEERMSLSAALRLVKALRADMGADFIISMAPVASALLRNGGNLSGFSYFDLDAQAVDSAGKKLVNFYNGQFYNGWGQPTLSWYSNIISNGWSADRVVMGVLTNPSNGGSGFVKLATLVSSIKQIRGQHPKMSGAVGWEYFNSGQSEGIANPWEWVKSISAAIFDPVSTKKLTVPKRAISIEALERPESPFESEKVRSLEERGITWSQAHAALNMTNGDLLKAREILHLVA